jgi:hypothetical protein
MDPLKITITLSVIAIICLTVCWLDHKNNWQLADWLNGRCSNPFTQTQNTTAKTTHALDDKEQLIQQLTERVQVLEKIVTEPSYELNKKLNQL